jgi:hypothetical protein
MAVSYEVLISRLGRKGPGAQTPQRVDGIEAKGLYHVLSHTNLGEQIAQALIALQKDPEEWHVAMGCEQRPHECKRKGSLVTEIHPLADDGSKEPTQKVPMCSKLTKTVCIQNCYYPK